MCMVFSVECNQNFFEENKCKDHIKVLHIVNKISGNIASTTFVKVVCEECGRKSFALRNIRQELKFCLIF